MRYALLFLLAAAPLAGKDSCLECHSQLTGVLQAPAVAFGNSVHHERGFTCADCHGGDPASDDPQASMSPARGFIGVPARTATPKLCARCHSNPEFMRKYNPSQRVDQYAEYLTSTHGQRLAKGDAMAAVCSDCHGLHDIRHARDPRSPVYPLNLPRTCAHCHADSAHMAPYKVSTSQYADYLKSVHWEELSKRGDLSAPSCATCHGNHGAKPPAVSSVAAVCGTCHVFEQQLFDKSPHRPAFSGMPTGACVVCHNNHAIVKATDRMLAGGDSICKECHDPDSAGGKAAAQMAASIAELQARIDAAGAILDRARTSGMEVSEAILRQTDARQNLIKARAHVHAFAVPAVNEPVRAGLAIAAENYRAGQAALKERTIRRWGLAISLATILFTMAGLWLTLRWVRTRRRPST